MRWLFLLWIVCLISSPVAPLTLAQSTLAWTVHLYDRGNNTLVELSAVRATTIALPEVGYQPRLPSEGAGGWYRRDAYAVRLSEDGRYLVWIVGHREPTVDEAIITDLVTGHTQTVPQPPLGETEFFVGYHLGAFSPDGQALALPYVSHDLSLGGGCCGNGGIVTVALATGDIIGWLDIDASYNAATAWVDDRTADGIWFAPRCAACTPPERYGYKVWNPATGAIAETDAYTHRGYIDQLAPTGERLYSQSNDAYPLGGGRSYRQRLNVVALYQPDQDIREAAEQVVYYDLSNLDFDASARWIAGGRAFLVTNEHYHNVVVWRDGRQVPFDYADVAEFLAMTADGWLAIDMATGQVSHYQATPYSVTRQAIYQAVGEVVVARVQWEPADIDAPFTLTYSPPTDVVFCAGALPSRVPVGGWAEVIADQEAFPLAALWVGDGDLDFTLNRPHQVLPIRAKVQVIAGPVCPNDGSGFLKVDYQGTIGWMMEVYGTGYYLAPTSPPPDSRAAPP